MSAVVLAVMVAVVPAAVVGLAVALLLGGAAAALWKAVAPPQMVAAAGSASTPSALAGIGHRRLVMGAVAAFVVLLATRWLLLSLLAGGLVVFWGRLVHDDRAEHERLRVEAIARWLEDLRDTLRGSSMAAEHALEHVAQRPPEAIAEPLARFVQRRRQGFRTDEALTLLADDLAHPTADAAIAAMLLVVGGSAGAGRLYGTVDALATAARDELAARERIDRTRAVYQSSMKRLMVIGALLVAYLRFAGGDLLDPYDTAVGQMVLLFPLGLWLGCILWLRSMCRYDLPARGRVEVAS
ncbi:MAG: type II secretion system F family protein [Actinomycetota bacterium]